MLRNVEELVKPGETAIVVVTRGDQLRFDHQGDGKTGNWKVDPKRQRVVTRSSYTIAVALPMTTVSISANIWV